MLHLSLLGCLLAGTDRRAHRFSSLPGGSSRFPGHPSGGVSAGHPTDRSRWQGVFGGSRIVPCFAPSTGTHSVVVVLHEPVWLCARERMGICLPSPAPRLVEPVHQAAVGTCASGGTLYAAELGFLTPVWPDLCGGFCLARRADLRIDRACRHPSGERFSRGRPR